MKMESYEKAESEVAAFSASCLASANEEAEASIQENEDKSSTESVILLVEFLQAAIKWR